MRPVPRPRSGLALRRRPVETEPGEQQSDNESTDYLEHQLKPLTWRKIGGEVAGAAVEYLGVAQGGERLQLAGIGIAEHDGEDRQITAARLIGAFRFILMIGVGAAVGHEHDGGGVLRGFRLAGQLVERAQQAFIDIGAAAGIGGIGLMQQVAGACASGLDRAVDPRFQTG